MSLSLARTYVRRINPVWQSIDEAETFVIYTKEVADVADHLEEDDDVQLVAVKSSRDC